MSIMLFCSVFDRFWQLNYAARMNLVNFKSTTVIDVIDRPWKSRLWTALGRPKAPAAGAEARRNFWSSDHSGTCSACFLVNISDVFYLYNIRFSNIFFCNILQLLLEGPGYYRIDKNVIFWWNRSGIIRAQVSLQSCTKESSSAKLNWKPLRL